MIKKVTIFWGEKHIALFIWCTCLECRCSVTSGSSPWWCKPWCTGISASGGSRWPWKSNLAGVPVCQQSAEKSM